MLSDLEYLALLSSHDSVVCPAQFHCMLLLFYDLGYLLLILDSMVLLFHDFVGLGPPAQFDIRYCC